MSYRENGHTRRSHTVFAGEHLIRKNIRWKNEMRKAQDIYILHTFNACTAKKMC